LAIKEGRKDISATFKVYEDEWHYEPMDKYIRHIVGNYAKPVRGLEEYVPSVSTIYDKKDFEEKCSGLTSLETVCILGLYDGS
jgi:hypothetical protein